MVYRLHYAGYVTAMGPPEPSQWVGPPGTPGEPGPEGPQGLPGNPTDLTGLPTTLPGLPGVMWNNNGMVSIS